MRSVWFIDLAGLRCLLTTRDQCHHRGMRFDVAAGPAPLRLVELTGRRMATPHGHLKRRT
jgi:hypothetical protein